MAAERSLGDGTPAAFVADRTRRGGFLKSKLAAATKQQMRTPDVLRRLPEAISCPWALSHPPHTRRPADPRKRGASFRRRRNKRLSRVKLRLRYRLSFLQSIRSTRSKCRKASSAASACNTGRFGSLASNPAARDTCRFRRHRLNSVNSGLEHRDGTFGSFLSTRTARRR
jgi:hypothetical protein